MTPDQQRVVAVEHPSLHGALGSFLEELRAESGCRGHGPARGRVPGPELIDRLCAPMTMRLGTVIDGQLVAVAAVDNEGTAAVAVAADFRRRGIADELIRVLAERAAATGYPPLHRLTSGPATLAG